MASPVPTAGTNWPPISDVDPSVPIFGSPTTQSVRQNFAVIKAELESLAAQTGLGEPIPVANGGTGSSTTPQGLINLGIHGYLDAWFTDRFGPAPIPVQIAYGGTGANNAFNARLNLGAAPLNSPAFTGNPTAPTPPSGDSSTTLATTAFVQTVVQNQV